MDPPLHVEVILNAPAPDTVLHGKVKEINMFQSRGVKCPWQAVECLRVQLLEERPFLLLGETFWCNLNFLVTMDAWEKSKKVKVLSSQAFKVQKNTQVSTKVSPQEQLHINKQLV